MIGALGVVFGDIGTSPIYAFRESIKASGHAADPIAIYGVLSLVFWAVILVVAIKYVLFVMRADNEGEGVRWHSSHSPCQLPVLCGALSSLSASEARHCFLVTR
jgi:hypothetical protein